MQCIYIPLSLSVFSIIIKARVFRIIGQSLRAGILIVFQEKSADRIWTLPNTQNPSFSLNALKTSDRHEARIVHQILQCLLINNKNNSHLLGATMCQATGKSFTCTILFSTIFILQKRELRLKEVNMSSIILAVMNGTCIQPSFAWLQSMCFQLCTCPPLQITLKCEKQT